jgi:chromate transporter
VIYLSLYFEFFKIGLFAVGGGLATVPFLYKLSAATAWFGPQDIVNMLAVAQITPGPIGVNMAALAGYTAGGFWGALAAALGIVSPAVLAIVMIANVLNKFAGNKYVQNAFKGMAAAVCALISVAVCKIAGAALLDAPAFAAGGRFADLLQFKAFIFFIILLFLIRRFKAHPFIYICLSAAAGLLIKF